MTTMTTRFFLDVHFIPAYKDGDRVGVWIRKKNGG